MTYLITWVRVNLNSGSSAAVGEPGAGVVLPQVTGGEVNLVMVMVIVTMSDVLG